MILKKTIMLADPIPLAFQNPLLGDDFYYNNLSFARNV